MPKKLPNKITWAKQKLRRVSTQWPTRTLAIQAARVSRGKYRCSSCKTIVGAKGFEMDHKEPVVPLEGSKKHPTRVLEDDLNEYADRLLCDQSNWALLCLQCHSIKTELEGKVREHHRNLKKKKKGKKK